MPKPERPFRLRVSPHPLAETDLAAEIRFLPQTRAEPSPARFPHDSLPLWGYSRRRDPFWPRTVHRGVRAAPPPGLVVFGTWLIRRLSSASDTVLVKSCISQAGWRDYGRGSLRSANM